MSYHCIFQDSYLLSFSSLSLSPHLILSPYSILDNFVNGSIISLIHSLTISNPLLCFCLLWLFFSFFLMESYFCVCLVIFGYVIYYILLIIQRNNLRLTIKRWSIRENFFFLGPHPWHMEVPGQEVQLEL